MRPLSQYEKELGPDTGQVNAAFDELRGMFVDSILSKRLDDPLPGYKVVKAAEVFISFLGDERWREIIEILADLSNGPSSVALQGRASVLISDVANEYADTWAHDYAARSL